MPVLITLGTATYFFYTFRDPNAAHSLDCFDKAVDFVKEFFMNGNGLDKLITGSISYSEPLSGPKGDMKMADTNYFCGVTFEDRCKARKEMLGTTKVDLLKLCDPLMAVLPRLKCGLSYASAATYILYHTPLNVLSSLQLNPALLSYGMLFYAKTSFIYDTVHPSLS